MAKQKTEKLEQGSYIGDIKIIAFAGEKAEKHRYECECKCGAHFIAYKEHLLSGRTKSCPRCAAGKDLTGTVIGTWKVSYRVGTTVSGHKIWRCHCEVCGAIADLSSRSIARKKWPVCDHNRNADETGFRYQF